MSKNEKKQNRDELTLARQVRYAGNSNVIALGTHIAAPGQWLEVTIKEITEISRISELQLQEKKIKQEARKQ